MVKEGRLKESDKNYRKERVEPYKVDKNNIYEGMRVIGVQLEDEKGANGHTEDWA